MILETKRLLLRPINMKDLGEIYDIVSNPNVSKWLINASFYDSKKDIGLWIKKSLKEQENKAYRFLIVLKSENKVIGFIGLFGIDNLHKTGCVGSWIGEHYWGNGYASESLTAILDLAFNKLKLRRVEASTLEENSRSQKVLKKFGFVKEGTRRKCLISRDGKTKYDEVIYGLLSEEYK